MTREFGPCVNLPCQSIACKLALNGYARFDCTCEECRENKEIKLLSTFSEFCNGTSFFVPQELLLQIKAEIAHLIKKVSYDYERQFYSSLEQYHSQKVKNTMRGMKARTRNTIFLRK